MPQLANVTFGSNVTSIGSSAFRETAIASITLPSGLTSIGDHAFQNCDALTSIVIPDNVTSIGSDAFEHCDNLASATIGAKVTSIGSSAFEDCTSLITVTGGASVTTINNYAFYNTRLTTTFIPDAVTTIGTYAFTRIPTLTTVSFGSSVKSIRREMIQYDSNDNQQITTITFNGAYTAIPSDFCRYMPQLANVTIGPNVTSIGSSAFMETPIASITLPSGLTTIGNSAFYNCDALTSIDFGGVTIIGTSAFAYCDLLETLVLGTHVETINDNAFEYCKALTSITFPASLRTIGQYAFQHCEALQTLTIDEGVTAINYGAFQYCYQLREVDLPATLTTINGYAFDYCDQLQKMTLPMGAVPFKSTQSFNSSLILFVPAAMLEEYRANSYTKDQRLAVLGIATQFNLTTTAGGQLQDQMIAAGAQPSTVLDLTITGPINGTDIDYLHGSLINLRVLDLGNAQIVNGGDSYHLWSVENNGTATKGSASWNSETDIVGQSMFANMPTLQRLVLPQTATAIRICGVGGNLQNLTELVLPAALTTIDEFAFAWNSSWSQNRPNAIRHLTIPSGVTSIGQGAFYYNTYLEEITIPNGITEIPASTFSHCRSLQSITFPNALTTIGSSAFYDIGAVTLSLPATLTTIGTYAFGSSRIEGTLTIPGSVQDVSDYAFQYCDYLEHVVLSEGVTRVGYQAFYSCEKLASISLPSTLTSIGQYALADSPKLASVTLPAGLTSLGNYAFTSCPLLEEFTFPNAITEVPTAVLSSCTALQRVTLAPNTTKINDSAFSSCPALTQCNFPSSLTFIGSSAFNNTGFTTVTLPNSAVLYSSCFANCANLQHINVPTAIDYVPTSFVSGCANLTQVDMHDGIRTLNNSCFSGCTSLSSITLNNNITSIGNEAFRNCINLALTALPSSLQTIGSSAFNNCDGLTTLTVPSGVTSIGYAAFAYSTLTGITLPTGASMSSRVFYDCNSLRSVQLPSDLTELPSETFGYCNSLPSVSLPGGLTNIASEAFEYCSALTTITLPETLTTIGGSAFYSSGLTSITIPDAVTSIGNYAFAYCQQLTSASLGRNQNYTANSSFDYFFQNEHMQTLRIYAGTVPQISDYYAPKNRGNITLEVPMGTQDLYDAADVWTDFNITTFLTGDKLAAEDYAILQDIYQLWDGENWTHGWDLRTDDRYIGKWYGVTTEGDHIVKIELPGNNLTGALTQRVFELPNLTELNLSSNHLTGNLGTVLGNEFSNDQMVKVRIYDNLLTGDIYPFATKLPNLTWLDVSYNRLTDISQPIPREKLNSNFYYNAQFVDYATKTPIITEGTPLIEVNLGEDFTWTPNSLLRYNHSSQNYTSTVGNLYWCYTSEWWYDHSISLNNSGYHDFVLNNGVYTLSKYRTFTGTKGAYVIYGFDGTSRTVIMRINWIDGDVNSDRTVDVADLQSMVYFAMNSGKADYQAFNFTTADTNTDDIIDVRDVVANVNAILDYDENEPPAGVRAYISHYTCARNVVAIENDVLRMANADDVAAMQFTLVGQRADDLMLAPELRGFSLSKRQVGDNTRVVIYNANGRTIAEGEHTLLLGVNPQAVILDPRLTDAEANYLEAGVRDIATDMGRMDNGQWTTDDAAIYDLGGRLIPSWKDAPSGVYVIKRGNKQWKVRK